MSKKGGLDMKGVMDFAEKAVNTTGKVAAVVAPMLPLLSMLIKRDKGGMSPNEIAGMSPNEIAGKKGKKSTKLVQKKAPKSVPSQLKPWMRVVETVRADPKHKNLTYKEQLKVAKKIYDAERP